MSRAMNLLVAFSILTLLTASCGPRQGLSTKETFDLILRGKAPGMDQVPTATPVPQSVATPTIQQDYIEQPDPPVPTNERERVIIATQKPIKGGEMIPKSFARALLEGSWKNRTCSDKVSVELTIERVYPTRRWLVVHGYVRIFDRSQESEFPVLNANLKGSFDPSGGFLAMESSPRFEGDGSPFDDDREIRKQEPQIAKMEKKYWEERRAVELNNSWKGIFGKVQAIQEFDNGRGKELKEEIEKIYHAKLSKVRAKRVRTDHVPLSFDIARDIEGKGWIGTIESELLSSCHEIQFVSEQGFTTEKLPPITGSVALARAVSRDLYRPTLQAQAYWLHIAEQQVGEKDSALLGQVYEDQGQRDPQNYVRAFQYYQAALNKSGDARAQIGLARLYAEGLGTAKNLAESQRWGQLAEHTYLVARKACTSIQSTTAIRSMMEELDKPSHTELLDMRAVNVISMNKPFSCLVKSKKTSEQRQRNAYNAVDSIIPDITYETTTTHKGGYKDTTYSDNSTEKALIGLGAVMLVSMGDGLNDDVFTVESLGTSNYKITWDDLWHNYSRPLSRTVEVH